MRITPILALTILAVVWPAISVITSIKPYKKMTTKFPNILNTGQLGIHKIMPPTNPKVGCAHICSLNSLCKLFCLKASLCYIYKSHIPDDYTGVTNSAYGFSYCFTSWYFPNNLALTAATATQNSMPWGGGWHARNALTGYAFYPSTPCSLTGQTGIGAWWMADLGSTMNVSYVAAVPRYGVTQQWFYDVEVRLGDSTTIQDNAFLGYFNDTLADMDPPQNDVYFVPPNVMAGRYLSLQTKRPGAHLYVCNVVIVGP